MTRRVACLAAFFSVAAFLPVSAVSADVGSGTNALIEMYLPRTQVDGPLGFSEPNDGVPWGLDRIDQRTPISYEVLDRSYTYSDDSTGEGVNVFIVDTGVQADHSEFRRDPDTGIAGDEFSIVQPGWTYQSDSEAMAAYAAAGYQPCSDTYTLNSTEYDRQITATEDFDNGTGIYSGINTSVIDNNFHGTHVASLVAGTLTGVAKNVNIFPVRVFDSCGRGNHVMLIEGLKWILNQGHIQNQKTIVNLSLMFRQRVPELDEIVTDLIDAGIVVIAAAGNISAEQITSPSNRDSCTISPAGSDGRVITVAASGWYDDETNFSFGGSCVDIFAPGYWNPGAWSYKKQTGPDFFVEPDAFLELPGTSMAAPHVSGAVARYLQGVSLAGVQSASVAANAMSWLRRQATCNAVTYFRSGVTQTPNRLLAVDAPIAIPCAPTTPVATGGVESATVSWTEPVAFNGEVPTYTATAQPGNRQCTTTSTSCTITGLAGGVRHTISVTASNSAGTSAANTTTVTPQTAPVLSGIELVPGNGSIVVRWNSSTTTDTTFTVVASPGGQKCVTTSTSCTIDGLSNNEQYSITVTGANYAGSSSVVGTASPNGAPSVPAAVRTTSRIGRVTFRWNAITDSANPTYTLATRDGSYSCTTTRTTCTIRNLPNGKGRTFYLRTSTSAGGISQLETSVRAWAGFNVRRTELKQSSRIFLTSIMTPVSTGRRTWQSSPQCRISGSRLITPRRATTCYLTLRVAKTQTQPAMSLRLKLAVR